ncbi:MAG: peptidoglycan-binding domain-containing protein [Bryobacteraceae bacterium]
MAAAPQSSNTKKKTTKSAAKKSSSAKKSASSKSKKKSTAAAGSWRTAGQRQPTPERYKEIQSALASRGYLEGGAANGVWRESSVDALKRFQQDQNLEPSGRITSLSLIALGLGPKHDQIGNAPSQATGK